MKKKTTTAILLATTMMLALMGCGSASTDTDSSSDAASVAEVNTDTNTTDDTSKETDADTDTSSDSASTDSSEAASTTTASSDASFTYKNETFTILDDLPTTLDKINAVGTIVPGTPVEIDTGSKLYDYDATKNDADFGIVTFTDNGKESVGQISLMGPNAKTSKGIGIGSSLKELTSTYGEPTTKRAKGYFYDYIFDKYVLSFDTNDDKVYVIYYYNLDYYNSRSKS
ncbi:hypothetical protein [Butyrivibrio sp. M55]|uniref:hypothetical protein n=1 Tax=Butyrivibrio sp. M55 TaxID=1855323 RepID=UPI0008F2D101|nr:hypothetical protein [Butyrivibrio sp. M55]SFU53111.1 hypothetical protein SAMN05216540_103176 [Butyrivibrio sp. M55]